MSVLLETSLGDIVIDLLVDYAPKTCENFLKLCKVKYYNYSPVYNIQRNFVFQTGDPIGPGYKDSDGGSSIWGLLQGPSKKAFAPEFHSELKHKERGTVTMATAPLPGDEKERVAGSQFLITLGDNIDYLDQDHRGAIFGHVVEGFDVLEKINNAFTDKNGRPLQDIRIRHTVILDDPFPDPPSLREPSKSPPPSEAQKATVRIADDETFEDELDEEAMAKLRAQRDMEARALTLELMGDLPFAEVKPPENVLFVCKLNPVTREEDLELIFGRFGTILSCEVIRDKKTGDSLQYAFIEFEDSKSVDRAYSKMDDVLIDDHRIHVDFSQSVSKLSDAWRHATIKKRMHTRGFGGIDSLEKRKQYRAEDVERERDKASSRYGMIHDRESERAASLRDRQDQGRDRDRDRDRDHYGDRKRRRSYSRSPKRDDKYRERDRYEDRRRHRSRDRSPRGDRYDDRRDDRRRR
ncbi:putative cyclophilin-type peptidyl-prolyl cis-trans isomerase [Rhizodiscina lignyota]|uniref:Peptidyl-prolyl cis-trans isomerase n=1 Tax=Rhizodiscina lignyota TaxID=1504668 RepID=A0A9P4I4N3_9PEZI|nr:putative cyclophilin-type peptidyl-prolyl cis-trans isomerase [Rhizodiscina lignyota]